MITKTDVLNLVTTLSLGVAEITECDRIWDELVIEMGSDPRGWFTTTATTDTGVAGDATNAEQYEFQSSLNLAKLVALFFGGRHLMRTDEVALRASAGRYWRTHVGTPICYVTEHQSDRTVRLYPKTDRISFAGAKPANQFLAVYTLSVKTATIQTVLAVPLALMVMAREFARESNHRDQNISQACQALAAQFLGMVAP